MIVMDSDPFADAPRFVAAFRAAIDAGGFSLSELHRRLRDNGNPVSISTLSSWRSGARHPEGAQSRSALADLEGLLGLAPQALSSLMGPGRRAGQAPSPGPIFSDDYERRKTETLAALDGDPPEYLREVSSSTVVQVGAHGGVSRYETRALLQATTASVRSIPLLLVVDEDATSEPAPFVSSGGLITRTFTHPDGGMIGARIELERPVNSPNTVILEYGFTVPDDYPPQRSVTHGTIRRSREMILWVQFTADAVPDWVNEFEEDAHEERELPKRQMEGTTAHAVRRQFGPGFFGLAWGGGAIEPPVSPNE